jgi:hypothetical protein
MALRKPTNEANFEDVSAQVQEQEQEQGTETVMTNTAQAANDTAAPAPAPAAAAPAAEAPQVAVPAVRPAGAVAVSNREEIAAQAKAFQRELDDMKGAADFSFGNYAVYKGSNGEISQTGSESVSLGRWAKVRLLAWDDHHEISPGSQEKNTKDFVAYSKEGKVIDHVIGEEMKGWVGKPVDDYVAHLRNEEGFSKASSKRFVDLSAALLGTDSGDGPVGTVIQVTLSPSSIPSFSKYQQSLKDQARCASMGLPGFSVPEDPFSFFVVREVVNANGNKWTKLNFAAQLPAKF